MAGRKRLWCFCASCMSPLLLPVHWLATGGTQNLHSIAPKAWRGAEQGRLFCLQGLRAVSQWKSSAELYFTESVQQSIRNTWKKKVFIVWKSILKNMQFYSKYLCELFILSIVHVSLFLMSVTHWNFPWERNAIFWPDWLCINISHYTMSFFFFFFLACYRGDWSNAAMLCSWESSHIHSPSHERQRWLSHTRLGVAGPPGQGSLKHQQDGCSLRLPYLATCYVMY